MCTYSSCYLVEKSSIINRSLSLSLAHFELLVAKHRNSGRASSSVKLEKENGIDMNTGKEVSNSMYCARQPSEQGKEYQKLHDADTAEGSDYEINMCILLTLRCLRNAYSFHIASNCDLAKPLDDIVLGFIDKMNVAHVWALQLKHGRSKRITADTLTQSSKQCKEFSLQKYVVENYPGQLQRFCETLGETVYDNAVLNYALYAVQDADIEKRRHSKKCILYSGSSNEPRGYTSTFSESHNSYLYARITLNSTKLCEEFERFHLFTSEADLYKVEDLISEEIQTTYQMSKEETNDIQCVMYNCVKKWWRSKSRGRLKSNEMGPVTLTENHLIVRNFFEYITKKLSETITENIRFNEKSINKLKAFMNHDEQVIIIESKYSYINLLWLLQAMLDLGLTYFVINNTHFSMYWKRVQQVWSSSWFDNLILQTITSSNVNIGLVNEFLHDHPHKKLFLLGFNFNLAGKVIKENITLYDVEENSRRDIMSKLFCFQGIMTSLADLADSETKLSLCKYISGQSVLELLGNQPSSVGSELEEPLNYYPLREVIPIDGLQVDNQNINSVILQSTLDLNLDFICIACPPYQGERDFLRMITYHTKMKNKIYWVVNINIHKYINLFSTEDGNVCDILRQIVLNQSTKSGGLEIDLYEYYQNYGKFVFIIDAIDCSYPTYIRNCINFCKQIQNMAILPKSVLLAARPLAVSAVAQELGLPQYQLLSLTNEICEL